MSENTLELLFIAAKNEGASFRAVVEATIACGPEWTSTKSVDVDHILKLRDVYQCGRVADIRNVDQTAAAAILALKPWDKTGEETEGRRTEKEQKACHTGSNGWSRVRKEAGAPNARNGGTRGPRASKEGEDKAQLPDALLPALVRAESVADVQAFMLRIADLTAKYHDLNALLCTGVVGDILRNMPTDMRTAVKADQGHVEGDVKVPPKANRGKTVKVTSTEA